MKNEASYQARILLKLASKNKSEQIYNTLNTLKGSPKYKGDVFEHFLAELYNKTGWKAQVTGGKGDKGVDILLYHPKKPSQVYAIVQTKNLKTRLSTKDLRHEYGNFFGDHFSFSKGSSQLHNCNQLIIVSLNGYAEDAKDFHHPNEDTHQVTHQDWSDVKALIEKYSGKGKKPPQKRLKRPPYLYTNIFTQAIVIKNKIIAAAKEYVGIFVIIMVVIVFIISRDFRQYNEYEDYILTDEMIARLHEKTTFTEARKADCQKLDFALKTCPQQLVERYMNNYEDGNLETGLMVYFCGLPRFQKGQCEKSVKKMVWYVLTGQ